MPQTAKGYRFPLGTQAAADLELFIQQLAEDVDASPGIKALTLAQREALTADQRWEGRKIWNVTAGVHQSWNGAQWVDDVSYSKAGTFTEDQTIESGNQLRFGDWGAVTGGADKNTILFLANARWDGTNWVRTRADVDAARMYLADKRDFVFEVSTDPGSTVGSTITWGEKFRITKAGQVTIQQTGGATSNLRIKYAVDAASMFDINTNGRLTWGPGGAGAHDTNFYRGGVDLVATDDRFMVGASAATGAILFLGSLAENRVIRTGVGSPEGAIAAHIASLFLRSDGGVGTVFYVKQTGTGNTGWKAVA